MMKGRRKRKTAKAIEALKILEVYSDLDARLWGFEDRRARRLIFMGPIHQAEVRETPSQVLQRELSIPDKT
jgi:hypothetical protein